MQIPAWLGDLNFVTDFVYQGCRVPYQLWVQLEAPIAGNTALELLGFDWGDVVRSMFKPKGLRSGRHGRKVGKRGLPGIPEIPELVIAESQTFEEIKSRKFGFGQALLWEFDEAYQRAVWEVGLLEMAGEFINKSVLATLSLKPTNCGGPGRARITGGEDDPFNNGQRYGIKLGTIVYEEGSAFGGTFNVFVGEGLWTILGNAVAIAGHDDTQGHCEILYTINQSPDGGTWQFTLDNIAAGQAKSCAWSAIFRGPANVGIDYRHGHNIAHYVDCALTVFPTI